MYFVVEFLFCIVVVCLDENDKDNVELFDLYKNMELSFLIELIVDVGSILI